MKISFIILVFILLTGSIWAQVPAVPSTSVKLDYSFQTGTSFGYAPGWGNSNLQYFAPKLNWDVNTKFKVTAGVMFIHSRYNLQPQTGTLSNQSVILNSGGDRFTSRVAAAGTYMVNAKLTLSGSFLSDFTSASSGYSSSNPLRMMSLDMNYKLSDNVHVGASFRVMQTQYRFSPYGWHTSGLNSFELNNGLGNFDF